MNDDKAKENFFIVKALKRFERTFLALGSVRMKST